MLEQRIRIGEGGKITIPASLRQALGVRPGDEVVMHLDHGELRLVPRSNALTRLRAAVKGTYDSPAENHTDNFLAIRRRDSE